MGWDGMGWDGMGWDGMGWDGTGRDGTGRDGGGWGGDLQRAVVDGGSLDSGEEVGHERGEERHVLRHKLGRVHVLDRAEQDDVLRVVGVGALERARRVEHRLDGAEAEVVVVLLRELLLHQVVERRHLLREHLGGLEALGEEHDLDDERDVRLHHRHGPQQRLEVLGQLGAARVAGVHRDEDAARRVELDLLALEPEELLVLRHGREDAQDLLRHDGEHLHLDAVELVEARPRARLREAREHAAERLVVEAVGAVEDDALLGQVLREVLDRLRLARARGALRQPAAVQVERGGERGVAAVGERRDNQPRRVGEVLVAVQVLRVRLPDDAALRAALLPVEAQLQQPLEVVDRRAARLDHPVDDVARVHLDRHDVDRLLPVELAQVAAHHVAQLREQVDLLLLRLPHRRLLPLGHRVERLGALDGPQDLPRRERHLPRPLADPLLALRLLHVAVAAEEQLRERGDHRALRRQQPALHRALADHVGRERDVLAVGRVEPHRLDVLAPLAA